MNKMVDVDDERKQEKRYPITSSSSFIFHIAYLLICAVCNKIIAKLQLDCVDMCKSNKCICVCLSQYGVGT